AVKGVVLSAAEAEAATPERQMVAPKSAGTSRVIGFCMCGESLAGAKIRQRAKYTDGCRKKHEKNAYGRFFARFPAGQGPHFRGVPGLSLYRRCGGGGRAFRWFSKSRQSPGSWGGKRRIRSLRGSRRGGPVISQGAVGLV